MAKKDSGENKTSPAWWVAYGLLCGLAAAGLLAWLNSPPRGEPISLLPAPTATATRVLVAAATPTATSTPGPLMVNINTATLEELQQLPNIGPVIAQDIINYRDAHGPFTVLQQLQNVSGIGGKTFEGIQPYITLGEE